MSRLTEIGTKHYKYLKFVKYQQTGKKTFLIKVSNHQDEILGKIVWRNGWRTYVYESYLGIQYDLKCLGNITKYIEELLDERKLKL